MPDAKKLTEAQRGVVRTFRKEVTGSRCWPTWSLPRPRSYWTGCCDDARLRDLAGGQET